jgi:hypothetical protein
MGCEAESVWWAHFATYLTLSVCALYTLSIALWPVLTPSLLLLFPLF